MNSSKKYLPYVLSFIGSFVILILVKMNDYSLAAKWSQDVVSAIFWIAMIVLFFSGYKIVEYAKKNPKKISSPFLTAVGITTIVCWLIAGFCSMVIMGSAQSGVDLGDIGIIFFAALAGAVIGTVSVGAIGTVLFLKSKNSV